MKLQHDYPISLLCELLGLARSSYYYQSQSPADETLAQAIGEVVGQWPTYGYRRVTAQLRREPYGWVINHKRVQATMQALGLQRKTRAKRTHTTQSTHAFPRYPNLVSDLVVMRPEQVWVADITYIHLRDEFVYLAVLMDVFTRTIRGWHLSRSLEQELTLTALQRALSQHRPEIHHSDQGVQYAATDYVALLQAHQVQISMAAVGKAWENGYAERLMRTIKEEEVDLSEYRDYDDACQQLGHFLDDVYQHKRIHSALGDLTPAEFESQWRAQHTHV
jgi:transposase InsO family protein